MELVFKHFYLVLILGTFVNGLFWWGRGAETRRDHPERVQSYRRLIAWSLVWANLPWIALGGGVLFGNMITPIDPLFMGELDFWGRAFWALVVLIPVFLAVYVFMLGGAQELADHPGAVSLPISWQTVLYWRIIAVLYVAMMLFVLTILWIVRDQLGLPPPQIFWGDGN